MNATTVHSIEVVGQLALIETDPIRQRVKHATAGEEQGTLVEMEGLDEGDPDELAGQHASVKAKFPHINVFGGCCGTDFTHVEKISSALQGTSAS